MATSKDQFKANATKTYNSLKAYFQPTSYPPNGGSHFWRAGHAFDTIVDYFLNIDRTDAGAFANTLLDKYNGYNPNSGGYWYDDHGWWGIACLKASAAPQLFGSAVTQFFAIALENWTIMYKNAPNGWKSRQPQDGYPDCEPLHVNGIWNHTLDPSDNPDLRQGPGNGLAGRQNTVTNGLYLVLAERLALAGKVHPIVAGAEFEFLTKWFQEPNADLCLLNNYDTENNRSVVRERVSYFKGGKKDYYYRKDLAWAGDQGLIVGGLADHMAMAGKTSREYETDRNLAIKVMNGTRDYLVGHTLQPGILKPWASCPPNSPPGDDFDDYWTGPAVYMRYLLSAFANDDLKSYLQQNYLDFISINAQYVVDHPYRPQSADDVVNLTNNLAILVAAVAMLPD